MIEENKKLYYTEVYKDTTNELPLVRIMYDVRNCTVMKYGCKNIKMDYYFCNCDPNQKDPICEACSENCHKNHLPTRINENQIKYIKPVCSCGIRCHRLKNDKSNSNISDGYQPVCYFHELGLNTKQYYYYQNKDNGNTICVFCGVFCLNDGRFWKDSINYERKVAPDEENFPACNCSSESHRNFRQILAYLYFYTDPNKIPLYGLTTTHLINLLFKSDNSFRNIYSYFLSELEQFEENMNNPNFEFDKHINTSNLYYVLGNFANMTSKCKEFFYFSPKGKDLIKMNFILKLLKKKISDHPILFNFIHTLLQYFQTFVISSAYVAFPKFNFLDFGNMNPFQRITITQLVRNNCKFMETFGLQAGEKHHISFIDTYIDYLQSMIRLRFENGEGFLIIFQITSLLKIFSKFYLISQEQIRNLTFLIDELIFFVTFFNKKAEKKHLKKILNKKHLNLRFSQTLLRYLCILLFIIMILFFKVV